MSSLDILDEGYNKPSVIMDESKLSLDYLPKSLRFREKHLKLLSHYLSGILNNNLSTNRVIITGKIGVGKTSVAKKFGQWLVYRQKEIDNVAIKYIHVNCRRLRTPFMILYQIIKEFDKHIPLRGYSASELLEVVIQIIEKEKSVLFLVLDEVEYMLSKSGVDFLYSLTRTSDDKQRQNHQIALVLIGRDKKFMSFLDPSTTSSLIAPIVQIPPYEVEELKGILQDRIEECFVPNSITQNSIELIANIAKEREGDARHALELLLIAGKHADIEGCSIVYPDHVRTAKGSLDPSSLLKETLQTLSFHKLLFLLAISQTLRQTKEAYLTTGIAEKSYHMLAEEYGVQARKHTQIWEYIKQLVILGVIFCKKSERGQRGNTQYISIVDLSLKELEEEVKKQLKRIQTTNKNF